MTDSELLTQFESLIDDTQDQALEIQLANNAKNRLEAEMKLAIHEKEDATNSTSAGQTYTTGINLPTDYREMIALDVGTERFRPVQFRSRVAARSLPSRYYIDQRQRKFYLTGTQASPQQITQTYRYKTDDITASSITNNTTTLTWPTEFHSLIPYEMAKLFYAIDGGDKARAWDDRWEANYQALRRAMQDWDATLKLAEMDGSAYQDDASINSENRIN